MTKLICIAPGHGGFDSGAVANGLKEKDINLQVCLELRDLLEKCGIKVIMTRTEDVAAGGATDEMDDLKNQCAISNDANAEVFFSIHVNAGGGHGAESYVFPNSSAYHLALDCTNAVGTIMGIHGEPVKYAHYYVLQNTNAPAVLTEIGFIDSDDAQKMEERIHDFAKVLAPVLVQYCGGDLSGLSDKPAPTPAPEPQPSPAPETSPSPAPTPDPKPPAILTCQGATKDDLNGAVQAVLTAIGKIQMPVPIPNQPIPARNDIATMDLNVSNDAFFFNLPVRIDGRPDITSAGMFQLDTGAYEILIDKAIADSMGLQGLGTQTISGVGGQVQATTSVLPVLLGEKVYNMPCCIVENWPDMDNGLFGMRGLIESGLSGIDINFKDSKFTIYA